MSRQTESVVGLLGGGLPTPNATIKALTVDNTQCTINTSNFQSTTQAVLLTIETADVRASFDGTNCNTTFGHLLTTTIPPVILPRAMVAAAKFSRASSTNGIIHYSELVFTDAS